MYCHGRYHGAYVLSEPVLWSIVVVNIVEGCYPFTWRRYSDKSLNGLRGYVTNWHFGV